MPIPVTQTLASRVRTLSFAVLAWCLPSAASACEAVSHDGAPYVVCAFEPAEAARLRLFWKSDGGHPFRSFGALRDDLAKRGETLEFAMNAGMYQADTTPVGLYVEAGATLHKANRADAPASARPVPNFYKKPNGIFFIGPDGAGILETGAYLKAAPDARYATQSGPLLVIDGALHPAFIDGSDDRKPRNGVGVRPDGTVVFAIADEPVNFHDFASLFRDRLSCPNALFLDGGSASGLYHKATNRDDFPPWEGYGPMVGLTRGP